MAPGATEVQLHQYEQAAEALRENLRRVMEADLRKKARVQKLEELVDELLVLYRPEGDEIDDRISALRGELGI
jgi:Arc/MetJ-type ribon-helix-helix transcriptional regulator